METDTIKKIFPFTKMKLINNNSFFLVALYWRIYAITSITSIKLVKFACINVLHRA